MRTIAVRFAALLAFLTLAAARPLLPRADGPVDPRLYAGLSWRNLGPFRAGRVASVSGAIGQSGVFYAGMPGGGLWKTTSAGETWYPVFDDVKEMSSIGAVEVAPSDPNVVYVGGGDLFTGGAINEGNGVYRSGDAGRTWHHVGLDASRQIPSMLVDPRDPNTVLVAAQGDVHAKSADRGVYRSTNGGSTWTRTLFVNDSTGMQKLARANDAPLVIFATSVPHYIAAPSTVAAPAPGRGTPPDTTSATGTALYKSVDGGVTWQRLAGGGLPRLTGRTSVAVAMTTNAQRVYLIAGSGLYRSDDGGTTWRQMAADDDRIRNGQGGYNCGVYVDPSNPDVVYTINTSSYKSTDGGRTFAGFKGAPGGDDPQQLWIDPTNGQRMLMGVDQGAIVSLDGGATWSSWYNQSTEQIYHLAVDNSFPYWVYGTQQDAGAIRTRIRGNLGAITPLDWNPVPGWEWGTVLPDPLDPNTVYSSGSGILKITYPGEQWINVSPAADPSKKLRITISQPLVFAPWNKHLLLAAFQSVMATTDGGAHWTPISPDLATLPTSPTGAIESMRASTVGVGTIWVGTNNGQVKVTQDAGKTWADASIPNLPWSDRAEVLCVEPSHFAAGTAYAVVDLHRVGDYAPYVFRTRDFGKSWTKIVTGLPTNQASGSFARVVRGDTKKAGLLFAGTESGMFVSFDDGDHWQSLSQNLPTTSYRDIAIKDNDLIVATYGRGFWVLDDFSMLRQLTPSIQGEAAHLFTPGDAVRIRRNVGADTPFPPEVPHALNPVEGVTLDYWLARAPSGELTIDVLDADGSVVRHLSSIAPAPVPEAARPPHPNFWIAPPQSVPADVGENRTSWDLRYDPPPVFRHSFEINANPGLTAASPEGPLALPGTYTIRLSVDGQSLSTRAIVLPDPRSTATPSALRAQHALQMRMVEGLRASHEGQRLANTLRIALRGAVPTGSPAELNDLASRASALAAQLDTVAGLDGARRPARGAAPPAPSFTAINNALAGQLNAQDYADLAPTAATLAGFAATCRDLAEVNAMLARISSTELAAFNAMLGTRGRRALTMPAALRKTPPCA